MTKFREVLKNRNFFLLWVGQIISQFGDRLSQMALIALIYARAPGSTFLLAKVLSFTIIPVFLVGPIACSYVDRWDHRRTMIFSNLIRAALIISLALFFVKSKDLWPIYIVIFAIFSVSRFFIPAKMAFIPELVSPEKLLLANSLSSTTGMIAAVAGFGVGGLIVERAGCAGGFIIASFSQLISGLFIFMIAVKAASHLKKETLKTRALEIEKLFKKTLLADIQEGWRYLTKNKHVHFVARMFFLLWSAVGAVYVVIIVFVQKTLGSVTKDLGFLAMFLGSGLFSGALIYGRFGQRLCKNRVIFFSLGSSAICLILFIMSLKLSSSVLVAAGFSFLLGLAVSPVIISAQTIIHEVTAKNMHGRIFGALEIVAHLAFLIFMFLSSFLAEKIGRFWVLLFVGVILTILSFGAILLKIDRREGLKNAGI